MRLLLSEVDAAVWEHSRIRQLYRNTLTTDFAQAFQNDHNNEHMDVVNEISPLVSQVIPSHSANSQTFSMRIEEFMCFHRSLCAFFLTG